MKISVITVTYQSAWTLEEADLRNLRQAKANGWRAAEARFNMEACVAQYVELFKVYDDNFNFQNIQK